MGDAALRPTGDGAELLTLQRLVGNQVVSRLIASSRDRAVRPGERAQSVRARPTPLLTRRQNADPAGVPIDRRVFDDEAQEAYDEALEEKAEFRADGPYGPDDYRASTGIGGFGVEYVTGAQILFITLRGSVKFIHGMNYVGGVAIPVQPTGGAVTAAQQINALPADQRAAAVEPWTWNEGEKVPWMDRFGSQIKTAWGGKFEFHIEKNYWEDISSTVSVNVFVTEGEKDGDDHMGMEVYKVPPTFVGGVGVVSSGLGIGGTSWGATNNEMTLNSNDIEPRVDSILNPTVIFASGANTLGGGELAKLDQFAARFKSGTGVGCPRCGADIAGTNAPVSVSMYGDGADEATNARERYDHLVSELSTRGFDTSRMSFRFAGNGNAGVMRVGSGVAQVVAAHEAGHMFGLGDEYAMDPGSGIGGTGKDAGQASKHDEAAQAAGLPGSVHENNDNIMSWGNAVQPQHYATFLEALKDVTDVDEWALGGAQPVLPPGPVDGPLPGTPDSGTRVA
jgi:hypothetical protein